ncbi:proline-rich protein HaeIII subfamily 1-like [Canis lupus familiaris]|uniref:proline-rich protein HaeIII subfamily 1-like n=1 Tax=Canis lupus familiaris TaxID=9615 RepID=UPI0018F3A81C|nr:proline-rich protein HaeIII subfamily 1-like [Canis lupus familiaris]
MAGPPARPPARAPPSDPARGRAAPAREGQSQAERGPRAPPFPPGTRPRPLGGCRRPAGPGPLRGETQVRPTWAVSARSGRGAGRAALGGDEAGASDSLPQPCTPALASCRPPCHVGKGRRDRQAARPDASLAQMEQRNKWAPPVEDPEMPAAWHGAPGLTSCQEQPPTPVLPTHISGVGRVQGGGSGPPQPQEGPGVSCLPPAQAAPFTQRH